MKRKKEGLTGLVTSCVGTAL